MTETNGFSILVVDDEEGIRSMIGDMLRYKGYKCITAKNGKEAFDSICNTKIDAVISDILMPELGGIDLLEKIKKRNITLPHLALISGFTETSVADIYDKGAEAFLAKPFPMEALVGTLKHLLSPMENWWKDDATATSETLNYTFSSFEAAKKEKYLLIGRGGFFVDSSIFTKMLNVGSRVQFEFSFADKKHKAMKGVGTVRWVRKKNQENLKTGFGIEFNSLDEGIRAEFLNDMQKSKAIAFIPKG